MKILIITPDYPDCKRSVYTFVKQMVDQFAADGHQCCVIAPYSVTKNYGIKKCVEIQKTGNEYEVSILRPNYISFSNWHIARFYLSNYFRRHAIKRALRHLPFMPDVIYAHFWRSGREIYPFAKKHNIPLFIACGESVIPQSDINSKYEDFYNYVSGVICVSTKSMKESIGNGMTTKEKCLLALNAINPQQFYMKDRKTCRKELGFDNDTFIVAFCGTLSHRKGIRKLSNAIGRIQGEKVYSMFIGRIGDELPTCDNILFQGEVAHEDVATFLSAADVFVLPTLQEGCCNAIIEAMACGLPIVSSDLPFNKDILNMDNSILINPESEYEIANAIIRLRDNLALRDRLSNGALKSAETMTIETRAGKIIDFVYSKICDD